MLKWPRKARIGLRKLFEETQDIDVYVEDENDEAFYRSLFRFATDDEIRITRVFSLNGRFNVISAASNHDFKKRRALFIVDGDLPFVKGEAGEFEKGVHVHNAYCVENLLLCELALTTLVAQENAIIDDDAARRLKYDEWRDTVHSPLVELFAAFATCHDFAPSVPTVSRGIGTVVTMDSKTKITKLDVKKVADLKASVLDAAAILSSQAVVLERYDQRLRIIRAMDNSINAVSGKDFLLPLIGFHLNGLGCKIQRKTLRIRLASAGGRERFSALAAALKDAANGVMRKN